jgi:pilus assembly protein Flp/PilA
VTFLKALVRDARAATAIEYSLLLAMLAMAMLTVLDSLGLTLAGVFDTIANALSGA